MGGGDSRRVCVKGGREERWDYLLIIRRGGLGECDRGRETAICQEGCSSL